ncbi:MAG: chorismate mutase [Elusimicrobiales bacterium]|nr:chorismate mutase [Elusimicrobiales bacterium]
MHNIRENLILKLRNEIDIIDNKLIKLLIKRLNIAKKIGKFKKENSIPIKDTKRENHIMKKVKKASKIYGKYIEKIYNEIIKVSTQIQK